MVGVGGARPQVRVGGKVTEEGPIHVVKMFGSFSCKGCV